MVVVVWPFFGGDSVFYGGEVAVAFDCGGGFYVVFCLCGGISVILQLACYIFFMNK